MSTIAIPATYDETAATQQIAQLRRDAGLLARYSDVFAPAGAEPVAFGTCAECGLDQPVLTVDRLQADEPDHMTYCHDCMRGALHHALDRQRAVGEAR